MADTDKARVLVVDDIRDIASAMARLLQSDRHDARAAFDSRGASELVATWQPHCVFFDVHMPAFDAEAFARHVRRTCGDGVVLVAMSAYDPVDDETCANVFRMTDHFFLKPVSVETLERVLPV